MVLFAIIDKGIMCKIKDVAGKKVVLLPDGYNTDCEFVRVYKLRKIV
jgi:hypothetical protein